MVIRKTSVVAAAIATIASGLIVGGAAPASATAATSVKVPVRPAAAYWHAYQQRGFSGTDTWFYGSTGYCVALNSVSIGWNDRVRSARTETEARVELWDNDNCSGGSITIDSSGYRSIGAWVSAYRVTYP